MSIRRHSVNFCDIVDLRLTSRCWANFRIISSRDGQRIALRSTGAHRGPVFALSQRVFVNQVTPAQAVRRFFVLLHYLVAFILFLKVEKTARPSREERLADFSRYAAQDPEKQKPSQVDDESWKQTRVPTIAVHLTELDKDLLGFNKALVMFPVCTNIMTPWLDPNDLLGQLVRETLTSYQASERGKHVAQSGELKFCVGHHKRDTFELGGHRYVVEAKNVMAKIDGTDLVFKCVHAELTTEQ